MWRSIPTLLSGLFLFASSSALVSLRCDQPILELDQEAVNDQWDVALSIGTEEIDIYQSVEHKISSFFQNNIIQANASVDIAVRSTFSLRQSTDDDTFTVLQADDYVAKCVMFEKPSQVWLVYVWTRDPHAKKTRVIASSRPDEALQKSQPPANCTNSKLSSKFGEIVKNASTLFHYPDFAMAKISVELASSFGGTWRVFVLPYSAAFRIEFSSFSLSCMSVEEEAERAGSNSFIVAWNVDPNFAVAEQQRMIKAIGAIELLSKMGVEAEEKNCEYPSKQLSLFAGLFGAVSTLLVVIAVRAILFAILRKHNY